MMTAFNYNPDANTDDGSCIEVVLGCTDETAFNYDETANVDDGSCIEVYGCTKPLTMMKLPIQMMDHVLLIDGVMCHTDDGHV